MSTSDEHERLTEIIGDLLGIYFEEAATEIILAAMQRCGLA
jgi:hypothetical protein